MPASATTRSSAGQHKWGRLCGHGEYNQREARKLIKFENGGPTHEATSARTTVKYIANREIMTRTSSHNEVKFATAGDFRVGYDMQSVLTIRGGQFWSRALHTKNET